MTRRRQRGDQGSAIVEAPFAIIVIMLLAMGAITITQMIFVHLSLAHGVRAGVRYASRADYDPSTNTGSATRRNETDVRVYTAGASGITGCTRADLTTTP